MPEIPGENGKNINDYPKVMALSKSPLPQHLIRPEVSFGVIILCKARA